MSNIFSRLLCDGIKFEQWTNMYVLKIDVKGSYPLGQVCEMCRKDKRLSVELAIRTSSKFFELRR